MAERGDPGLLEALIALARRYWPLMIAAALGGGLLAAVAAAREEKIHEARAELLVRFGWEHLYRPWTEHAEGWQPARMVELVNAEVRLLSSRTVRERAIREIGVEVVYPGLDDGRGGRSPPGGAASPRGEGRDEASDLGPAQLERALALSERALAARALGDSSSILLSFRHPEPETATRVLTAIIDAYLDERVRVFIGDEPAAATLRLEEAEARLGEARAALGDYLAANGGATLEQQLEVALSTARSLQQESLQAEIQAGGQREIIDETNRRLAMRHAGAAMPSGPALPSELEARLDAHFRRAVLIDAASGQNGPAQSSHRAERAELLAALRSAYADAEGNEALDSDAELLLETQLSARQALARAEAAGAQPRRALAALEPQITSLHRRSEEIASLREVVDAALSTRRDAIARVGAARSLVRFAERRLQSVEMVDPPFTPATPLGLGLLEKVALGAIIGAVLGGCIAAVADRRAVGQGRSA